MIRQTSQLGDVRFDLVTKRNGIGHDLALSFNGDERVVVRRFHDGSITVFVDGLPVVGGHIEGKARS